MPQSFPFRLLPKYPHMKPADVAIWERFINKNPGYYDEVFYDVHVGSAPEFDTNVGDTPQSDDVKLYLKKIDVVGFKGDNVDIIELKPNGGAAALGQVRGYVALYKRDIDEESNPRAVLITDTMKLDMEMLAKELEVDVIVV
jgi:hypothetical protein